MKKFLNIFLTCIVLFSALYASGCVKDDDYYLRVADGYIIREAKDGLALMGAAKTLVEDNVFVVPQEIKGMPVVSIGYHKRPLWPTDDWDAVLRFRANNDIKKIVINHDIRIHPYALNELRYLCEIEMNSSLSESEGSSTFGAYNLLGLTLNAESTDDLNNWMGDARELRTLRLQTEKLNRLMLRYPEKLIAYFAGGVKSISDIFSRYKNLSVFVVPETVTEIESGAFENCSLDLYFRTTEEDCAESIKNALPADCNIVWGFKDEIIIFDALNENGIIFEETNKNYQVVANGGKIQCPETPSKDGCVFDGWYSDYAYSKKWDFENDTVSDSMTLVAKWI